MSSNLAVALVRDDRVTCYAHQAFAQYHADRHNPPTASRLLAEALEIDRIRARPGAGV
ncbi:MULTISPECIES: hypothetical protein [Streptomyces]|uniref:hypothetical protein n=1 Tax=Streptomyces TaxID=1883 RepID=UPI00158493FB|nr:MULTISPECIES: hypothetical protein [Streptomyces]NUK20782.1 hypothetical protein [Streptomyces lunaelactis]